MEYKKTISFITPCYNDGLTIEKLVRSLKDQDLPDIEIIVVNDGSTDNSKQILDGLKEQGLLDKLIHLEKNEGACVARNTGAQIAEGKYYAFLPADSALYPGMARIWYENLEDNSEYDFLYGGYRFVDENGDPLPNGDYFFHPFEPYLLEVSNYIDGSFPIKAESFWKYAKIMGQEDGLWDKNVKSLQDWDYWLSVVKNGGKGIYIQDIFFETTIPHPGGLSEDSANNWIERTSFIKRKHKIPNRKLCVGSLGAGWHAKRIAYMLNADFKEMPSFKPHEYEALYVIGFYPEFAAQQDQMFLNNLYKPEEGRTPAKKVVHFVGTDVWQLYNLSLRSLKVWQSYLKNAVDVILCESDFIQNELKELGIEAQILPLPPLKLFELKPLPKDFTVACYMPAVNREFYRPNDMIEVVKKCPDIKFKFFGNPQQVGKDPALPDNIEYAGFVDNMETFIEECSAIMRFPIHDGLPISVLEFLLAGRYSVQSVPILHSLFVPEFSVDNVVQALQELKRLAIEPNTIASDYWRQELNHDKFKNKILELTGYNPKEYWENRAESWQNQAQQMSIEKDDVTTVLKEVSPQSILDIGCGDGRWYQILKENGVEEYTGIDISEKLIKAAQTRFPHEERSFIPSKVEDFVTEKKYDLVFSYTCLEHIKEEDWDRAVEAIKKMGRKLLLIEPTNFTSRYYCRNHDYEKSFKVLKKVELKDKVILLCDLETKRKRSDDNKK